MFTIYRCGARIMIVGAGSVMELGTTLSKQTGVDGTETLTTFQAAGAKIVDLTTRQYDVLRINVRAGRAVA